MKTARNFRDYPVWQAAVDFVHFLDMALGSASEVETQLLIAKNIGYLEENLYKELQDECVSIEHQLGGLIRSIRKA